jgi:hypothetical protein
MIAQQRRSLDSAHGDAALIYVLSAPPLTPLRRLYR